MSECDICAQEFTASGKQSMLVLVPCGHSCCAECYHDQHKNKVYTNLNNTKKDKNICHKCGLNITSKLVSPTTNFIVGERTKFKKQLDKTEKARVALYAENEKLKDRIEKLEEELEEARNGEEHKEKRFPPKKEKDKALILQEEEAKAEALRIAEKKKMKSKASKERKEREKIEQQRLEEEEIIRQEILQLDKQMFQVGDVAKIINLINQDSLNGGLGEILGCIEEQDESGKVVGVRFTLQLMGNKRQIGVKPANLVLVSRPVIDAQPENQENDEENNNNQNNNNQNNNEDGENYEENDNEEEQEEEEEENQNSKNPGDTWPVCSACTYENLEPDCIENRICEMCDTHNPP